MTTFGDRRLTDGQLREAAWVARCVGRADTAPLAEGDLVALATYLERHETPRGSMLFRQGEFPPTVWIVRSGTAELTVGSGRGSVVVDVLRPGDTEGDISLLLDQAPPYSGWAAQDMVCLFLTAPAFERLLREHPAVARRWLSSVATRLARSHRRIVELLGRPLLTQVARLLLDEAVEDQVQFAQRTLAAMLGVQRPALNKGLKDLERRGLITVGYRSISLQQRDMLEHLASAKG